MADPMNGLPGLSYGPSYGPSYAEPAPVARNPDAGSIFGALADAAGKLGGMAENAAIDEATESAKKEGAQYGNDLASGKVQIVRDASGNLVRQTKLLPAADTAYVHAAELAYISGKELDWKGQLQQARDQHYDDPDGFRAAAQGIKESALANLPFGDWAPAASRAIDQDTADHLSAIANAKLANNLAQQKSTVEAKLESNSNDLADLASNHALHTPRGDALLNQTIDIIRSKTGNPLFDYSPEQADLDVRQLQARLHAEAVLGDFKRSGDVSGLASVQEALRDPSLSPEQTLRLQSRAEAIQRDFQEQARQTEIADRQTAAKLSDDTLKNMFDLASAGKLTSAVVQANRDKMNAADYSVAYGLTRRDAAERDDAGLVSDLAVNLDKIPPDQFAAQVARGMRQGRIKVDTGRTLINQNRAAFQDSEPASPYKQGRAFVANSLDANPFGSGPDFGVKKQTQANALADYDAWSAQNPAASAQDALAAGQLIVQHYSAIGDALTPGAIGSPYGYSGVLSGVTKDDIARSAAKLKADRAAGRVSDLQYQAQVNRLGAWQRNLAAQEAAKAAAKNAPKVK